MPLAARQSLSFYEIVGPLGAGGMGEVYRARDTRLEREVAIKVLPEELAGDEERLRRFEREAKTLASLNHPNVAGIHGVDQEGDICFLALELVPGEDLATRLARGPLPVDEAMDLCGQIAAGLEAAHEAGVVHRDLKPANVRVTPEGVVKLLDFGLAKPVAPKVGRGGTTSAAESDSFLMTEEGLVLGTPTYMSPEQARGKPVDRRTDIWAFGCVLFECLTGKRAFGGESLTDILAAIVSDEPDWSLVPTLPRSVNEVLHRCLEKDPRTRLRDIGEARVRLERGGGDEVQPALVAKPSRGLALLGLVAGILVGAGALWAIGGGGGSAASVGLERPLYVALPSSSSAYHNLFHPSISPDGRSVVFHATRRDDDTQLLWLRSLDSPEAQPLPGTESPQAVWWSPDGTAIAFAVAGEELKILRLGDTVTRSIKTRGELRSGSWSSSGWIVYAEAEGPLWKVPQEGGEPVQITQVDREGGEIQHNAPTFLPGGDRFLFLAVVRQGETWEPKHRLYASSLSDPTRIELGRLAGRPFYTDRGELVFTEEGRVRSVPFDAETLTFTGDPVTLADGVAYFQPVGDAHLTVSRRGDVAFREREHSEELVWLDERGVELDSLAEPGYYGFGVRLSPDGRSLAISKVDEHTYLADVWVHGTERGTVRRVTSHPAFESAPVWSHDGRSLYYATDIRGRYPDVMRIESDGRGEPSLVWDAEGTQFPIDVNHAGDQLLVYSPGGYWLVPTEGSGDPRKVEGLENAGRSMRFSPDDQWIAYWSRESGEPQVYLHELGGANRTIQVSVDGGEDPTWAPQGRKLYFTKGGEQVWEVDLSTEVQLANPRPRILFASSRLIGSIEVSTDGERFLARCLPHEASPVHVLLRGRP